MIKFVSAGILPFTLAAEKLGTALGRDTSKLKEFNTGLQELSDVSFSQILEDKVKKIDDIGKSTAATTKTIKDSVQTLTTDLAGFAFETPATTEMLRD